MNGFSDYETADRRLAILTILSEADGWRAGAPLMQRALGALYAHQVSIDRLQADLAWLKEVGLVEVEDGNVVFARLTQRGLDVAEGRAKVPGIARPGP